VPLKSSSRIVDESIAIVVDAVRLLHPAGDRRVHFHTRIQRQLTGELRMIDIHSGVTTADKHIVPRTFAPKVVRVHGTTPQLSAVAVELLPKSPVAEDWRL